MNIVIAGAGAVGTHLAKMLSRQEHNILLIDSDQEKVEALESQLDIMSVVGSCTSIGALKDAEVGKCDLYIAVNPLEDQNINSAILAKKLGAKRTIARVNNSEYLESENAEYLKSIGIVQEFSVLRRHIFSKSHICLLINEHLISVSLH